MPSTLIGPIVGAGASYGLGKLFGGSKNPSDALAAFRPQGFSAGGLSTYYGGPNNTDIGITADPKRQGLVGGLANTFGQQAGDIQGLRAKVEPGFNDLLRTRLDALNTARTQSIGNLRENLARRRVLGSSFGQDAISRGNAEFAKQQDALVADNFLRSLEASQQLMQQQFAAQRGQFQTGLDELNLEASMAASLAGKATDIMAKNSQLMAELDAKALAGAGQFAGFFGNKIGDAAGKYFSGSGFFGSGMGSGGMGLGLTGTGGLY